MSHTQHTPGPWFYDWSSKINDHIIGWHVGRQVAPMDEMGCIEHMITVPNDHDGAEANARLIAAAPELLEALKDILAEIKNEHGDPSQDVLDRIEGISNRAIAKAEGGAA